MNCVEDTVCQVCFQGAALHPDLKRCTGCQIYVHSVCYGLDAEHLSVFTCQKCWELGASQSLPCSLCAGDKGAFKRVDETWAHALCLLFSSRYQLQSMRNMHFTTGSALQRLPQQCCLCGIDQGEVFRCQFCPSTSHIYCAFSHSRQIWDYANVLKGQQHPLCGNHTPVSRVKCVCSLPCSEAQVWKCQLCRGRFHTCVQTDSLEQPFLCKHCQKWKETRLRLHREDSGGAKACGPWTFPREELPLVDRLLIGRVVESRAQRLMQICTIEDIREMQGLAGLMCGKWTGLEGLRRKAEWAGKLERRAVELVENCRKEEVSVVAIQELEKACQSQGLILSQLPTLRQAASQSEAITRIKALTHTSHRAPLAEAQAFLPAAISTLGAHSRWAKYLSLAVDKALQWKGEVEASVNGQGGKLGRQEAREMREKGLKLTLRVRETLDLLEEKLAETEQWEKALEKTAFPLSPDLLPSFFPLLEISIWTPQQAEMAFALAQYQSWEDQTTAYLEGSEPVPLQTLQQYIAQAQTMSRFVSVSESKVQTMETIYGESLAWSLEAQKALNAPHPPAYMSRLLQQASALRARPPELPSVQARSHINSSIAQALQSPCSETYLRSLHTQAKALYADSQYINSLEVRIDSMDEFLAKVRNLVTNAAESEEVYETLIEEMDTLKLDLTQERSYMQDAIASIRCLRQLQSTAKQKELQDLTEAGLKIRYKLPALEVALTQILENYWAREWGNREKSLSELIEIDNSQGNCSPKSFKTHLERVQAAICELEKVSEQSLSDPQSLIDAISTNLSTLEQEQVQLPCHFQGLSRLSAWAHWSQSVFAALQGETKPSAQCLYTLNDQALSLAVPGAAPAFEALNTALGLYEQWLSRFCAYQEGKRRYKGRKEPYLILERQKSDPKPGESEVKALLKQGEGLACDCNSELNVLITDLEKASFWGTRVDMILEKGNWADLLVTAKRSCQIAKEGTSHSSLEQAAKTYAEEITVNLAHYTPAVGTYFWHFRAMEVLQGTEKVKTDLWDCLVAQIPLLDPDQRDNLIVERVNRQESLRRRLELYSAVQTTSMDQLMGICKEFQACKVQIPQENAILALMQRASQALEAFEKLWTRGAEEGEIDQAWSQLTSVGVAVPGLESQLAQTKAQVRDLREAAQELLRKDRKSSKELVRNVLETARLVPIRIAEIDQLQGLMENTEMALGEIGRMTESTSLEVVLRAVERLEELAVQVEPEETALREQLWKRKVNLALSSLSRPAIPTLQGWLQEAQGQGSQERSDLTALLTPRPVPVLKSELTQNSEEIGDYIPPKRGKSQVSASPDPVRAAAVTTIATALIEDYEVPAESAALLAPKLENCLYRQSYDYQQGLQTFLQTLEGLANFEEFWEKLVGEGIEWKQVLALSPLDLRREQVLKRLFGCLPRVSLRVDMRKLAGFNKETASKLEGNKAQTDASNHFLTDIINDFKAFKGMQIEAKKDCETESCDPPKRPAATPPPNPIKTPKFEPIPTANVKSDQSNEYSLLDCLPTSKTHSKGRMYDPNRSNSLWKGVVSYCGERVQVNICGAERLQEGRKLPRNGEKVKISGRIKATELETCLQESAASGLLSVCWVEASAGSRLVRDLEGRNSALVAKYESCLVIYLALWSDSLQKAISKERSFHSKGKIAAFLVHKPVPSPAETPLSPDPDEDQDFRLIESILTKLQSGQTLSPDDLNQLKSILLRHPSPEVSQLIASINAQLRLPKDSGDSVTDFLASQAGAAKAREAGCHFPSRFSA